MTMQLADLQDAFKKLPRPSLQSQWDKHRLELQKWMGSRRAARFLKSGVIHATMFVGEAPYIELELDELLLDKNEIWGTPLYESNVGDPPRLSYCEWTSGNRVHQCYHLKQFIDRTKIHPSDLRYVFEVGGGYGLLCHIFHRMRFKGMYSLYDFPEFLLLQEHYLSEHDVEAEYNEGILVHGQVDLFVALFSLSEMPVGARENIFERVKANAYLFAYHPTWEGVNNIGWFRSVQDRLPEFNWWDFEAKYKPEYRYLIGARG